MFEDSKLVFITQPYYAVNNPTNNYRIYKKLKHSNKWVYIQCKNKEEYREKIKEYLGGFFVYGRNEEKAQVNAKEFIKAKDSISLFDYFMGDKKSEITMKENQMKREEMAMLKDGSFLLDKQVPYLSKKWCNYVEDSNIQLTVLSFNRKYIDNNINVKELQKKIATDVIPKFLSKCGYVDPKKNLEWCVALHSDREDNYHFHIAWIEKNKCYRNQNNTLSHRIKLTLSDEEINFLKRQSTLAIERKRLYTPALIKLEKDFGELKSFFDPTDKNFTLKNINDINLEDKIIKLGFLLNQVRDTNKKYIKFNSLPKDEIGDAIRKLTKDIKKEIFKNKIIKDSKEEIYKSIEKINNILLDIDKRNNISNIGFETALENKMIQDKLEKNENYIFNAIANHALYNFNSNNKRIKKNNFVIEDIINQIAYDNYVSDFNEDKTKRIKVYKIKILKNYFSNYTYKNKIEKAFTRLNYEQDQAAEKFYEMFESEELKK